MIFGDSSAALAAVARCQSAGAREVLGMTPECDLVQRLWPTMPHSIRKFHKIKAHADPTKTQDLLDCYFQLGYLVADSAAVHIAKNQFPSSVADISEHHNQLLEQRSMLQKLYSLQLQSKCRAQLSTTLDAENQRQTKTFAAPRFVRF